MRRAHLLLRSNNKHGEHRKYCAVHRHRRRDFLEWYVVEEKLKWWRQSCYVTAYNGKCFFIVSALCYFHVFHRIDGNSRHSDVTHNTRVVTVIPDRKKTNTHHPFNRCFWFNHLLPSVSGKIKSNAQALLSGFDVFFVEGIALFDCAEAGVLSDRPRTLRVHRRIRTARVRKLARNFIVKVGNVLRCV